MSRKYKQSGYMEEGAPSERRPKAVRERPEGPRGRGLGAPRETAARCSRCGQRQSGPGPAFDAVCAQCGSDLHTCTQCAHFDTSSRFQCREEISERIGKKDARNNCELFESRLTQEFAADSERPSDARTAFDDLFNL